MVQLGASILVQQEHRPAVQPSGISAIGARNNKSPPRISTPSSLRGVRLRALESLRLASEALTGSRKSLYLDSEIGSPRNSPKAPGMPLMQSG
jgi:hypothetical protein